MKGSIKLSPEHGLNPTLLICPLCGKDTNGLALVGRLKGDAKAPERMIDRDVCNECSGHMKLGFLIIESIEDDRGTVCTGQRWVISTEAARRIFTEEIVKGGAARITPKDADAMGLPRGDHG